MAAASGSSDSTSDLAFDERASPRACVALFGASWAKPGDDLYKLAHGAGSEIAKAGLTVINGGYQGTMEASARGAKEAGG